jgi:hypothetical protein
MKLLGKAFAWGCLIFGLTFAIFLLLEGINAPDWLTRISYMVIAWPTEILIPTIDNLSPPKKDVFNSPLRVDAILLGFLIEVFIYTLIIYAINKRHEGYFKSKK